MLLESSIRLTYNCLCISQNQSKCDNNWISYTEWYVGVYNRACLS